jgi:hypothetical protein
MMLAGVLLSLAGRASAQPKAGDVFREYPMATGMLRIGERWEWGGKNSGRNITLAAKNRAAPWAVDLTDAVRAEVQVSFDQCHGRTTGLRIAFNDNDYIPLPIPEAIPKPQANYMFWIYPTVEVPLKHLTAGRNVFKMRVKADPRPKGKGGWMQNLVYAVVLRVFYEPSKPHATGTVTSPKAGAAVGRSATLTAETRGAVERVDFLGFYEDHDYEGNGIYRQWHYTYDLAAGIANHLGTAAKAPYSVVWDTTWVPDQPGPMKFAARIVDEKGMIYMTPAVEGVKLVRPGHSVELCKPFDVPAGWVTRKGGKSASFNVTGDLAKATGAIVKCRVWKYEGNCAWSVNGKKVGALRTSKGAVTVNELPVKLLRAGKNTAATSRYGHHGVEICFPGIVPLIRYETPAPKAP